MSIDALGTNTNSSTLELLKELREAKKAMEAAVQAGDIKSAQQNLATVQQDTQSIQSARATSGAPQDSNPYRSVLKTDLSNLTSAIQGGDIGAAQSAFETFQQDKQAIQGVGPNDAASGTASATGNAFLDDLKALLASAVSGDASGVQNAATSLQKDLLATSADGTPANDAASASDPTQNPFLHDLNALIGAAQSQDTAGMQDAAKNLAKDIQGAVNIATGRKVGGHHHHHHHQATEAASASPDTTNASAATQPTGDGDGDKDTQSDPSVGQPSATAVNSALKNARDAYELLMSFSQESSKAA
jgi:ribosomal protein S20